MTHTPTLEQQQCIDLFKSGADIIINAFAGAGKTSTLVMLANNAPLESRGLYVAFNQSIVREAKNKFPKNIDSTTINALALKGLAHFTKEEKQHKIHNPKKIKRSNIKNFFRNLPKYYYYTFQSSEDTFDDVYLYENDLFELIYLTINNYLKSDLHELLPSHVPIIGVMNGVDNQEISCHLKIYITKLAKEYLVDAFNNHSFAPLGYQGSVKLWSLNNPVLPYDFILLDEAQDTDAVFAYVLKKQNCQKVIVGDKYQQIYSWRGAINAMDKFDINNTVYLTESFRFGPGIAELASGILKLCEENKYIYGHGYRSIIPCDRLPQAYLCKTNAGVIAVILELINNGFVPAIPKNVLSDINKIKEISKILNGQISNDPLFMGISNYSQLVACAETEPQGEINSYLRLIEKFPLNSILNSLDKLKHFPANGPVVTTIHKAKGNEWDFVEIHHDFPNPFQSDGIFYLSSELLNLIYVAITRAKIGLTIPNSIRDYINIEKQNRKFQLQTPRNSISCKGFCPQCSLVTMEIACHFDEIN